MSELIDKNTAAIAFAEGKEVQCRDKSDLDWYTAKTFGAFDDWDEFRIAPKPIPPGNLTYEEAVECIRRHEAVQVWSAGFSQWCDSGANDQWDMSKLGRKRAYRRKPAPKMTKLGPEDIIPGTIIGKESWPKYCWVNITSVNRCEVRTDTISIDWDKLRKFYLYKPGGIGDWKKCEKEIQA